MVKARACSRSDLSAAASCGHAAAQAAPSLHRCDLAVHPVCSLRLAETGHDDGVVADGAGFDGRQLAGGDRADDCPEAVAFQTARLDQVADAGVRTELGDQLGDDGVVLWIGVVPFLDLFPRSGHNGHGTSIRLSTIVPTEFWNSSRPPRTISPRIGGSVAGSRRPKAAVRPDFTEPSLE